MRNHGLIDRNTVTRFGTVSPLETLQAVIVNYRLAKMPSIIKRRRANAMRYQQLLDPDVVFRPPERRYKSTSNCALVIQVDHRDALQAHLAKEGVGTTIYYPIPIHLQPAAAQLGYKKGACLVTERQAERILTLPINRRLSDDDIAFVCATVNEFLRVKRRAAGNNGAARVKQNA
jgi:dTDP-4-amino-4,6-dideoxygalactose transaminase